MFVDASALTAILISESDGDELEARLMTATSGRTTSPIAIFETALAISTRRGLSLSQSETRVLTYLEAAGIAVIDVTPQIGRQALAARAKFGKGTGHPAKLNLGDCFAYACAQALSAPLLYKGNDFAKTDLA